MTVRFPRRSLPAMHLRDLALIGVLVFLLADRGLPALKAFAQSSPPGPAAVGDAQTAFTYQGRLAVDGVPANGNYDVSFVLWNAAAAGSQVATAGPYTSVPVTNGLFSVSVDFALPYLEGAPRWIEVLVKPTGGANPPVSLGRLPFTTPPHDHLYQDWIGGSANPGLSIRNLGTGDGLNLEASDGNALEATSSGAAATLNVANQANGNGIYATSNTGPAAVQGVASQGIGVAGATFKTGFPGVSGVNGNAGCSSSITNDRIDLGPACIGVIGVADLSNFGGMGIFGNGSSWGVYGKSDDGTGVRGEAWGSSPAVEGANTGANCTPTVIFICSGVSGSGPKRGVVGRTTAFCNSTASISTVCIGVAGESLNGSASIGVYGKGSFAGVYGDNNGGGSYAGYFNGNVYISGAILPAPSDVKLKHDIAPATSGLDTILALKPSTYAWNDPAPWDEAGRTHNGFIAQEVRDVLPSAVYVRDESGTLGLDYNEITAVLVKAVQEQNAVIEELRTGDAPAASETMLGRQGDLVARGGVVLALGFSLLGLGIAAGRKWGARAIAGPRS